jgi:hypothetical protein
MGDGETTTPLWAGNESTRACQRCGSPVQLITVLPPTDQHPRYYLYGCTLCTFIEWAAEHVVGN